jgi:hypothetical protein
MPEYRTTDHELRYYSTDLSKYIGEELPVVMTSINGDILEYKRDRKWLRHIEYKHENEPANEAQLELYYTICLLKAPEGYLHDVYVVRGDPPFGNGISITDLKTHQTLHLTNDEMNKFLIFQKGFCTISEILKSRSEVQPEGVSA